MSEVGFEPTPTYVDQNTQPLLRGKITLESGALDHSATLTGALKADASVAQGLRGPEGKRLWQQLLILVFFFQLLLLRVSKKVLYLVMLL